MNTRGKFRMHPLIIIIINNSTFDSLLNQSWQLLKERRKGNTLQPAQLHTRLFFSWWLDGYGGNNIIGTTSGL